MEKNPRQSIFVPETRVGMLSPYAEKLVAEVFVWLASLIAFGAAANSGRIVSCNGLCRWTIVAGVIAWLYVSVVLVLNYLCSTGAMSRYGFFSHRAEMQMMSLLVLWWAIGAATASARRSTTSGVGQFFAWAAFFGSIFATYKAYHSFKEEDEPDEVPYDFDDGAYIYG